MKTYLYMVRHAESPYVHGNERLRGLSEKGKEDARKIADILKHEGIEVFVSSPYTRAIETISVLAEASRKPIAQYEALHERAIGSMEVEIQMQDLLAAIKQSFSDKDYKLEGGESTREAQERSVPIIRQLLTEHAGKKVAIGTHGNIMTIILNHFDETYGYDFWESTTKPDIYRLAFDDTQLVSVDRLWS